VSDQPHGPETPRYRFPPLERRGVVAGWRAGQLVSVASALVVAVLAVRGRPTVGGVAVAVVVVGLGVAVAFWPVAGRTGDQWLPVIARWVWAARSGGRLQLAPDLRPGRPVPTVFDGLEVVDIDLGGAAAMGALADARARTLTAVLQVAGGSFALLGPDEQEHRIAAWARVLASAARQGSAVHRLQWVETCRADDGRAVRGHLATHGVLDAATGAARSYAALLDEVAPVVRRHQVLVAVTVHRGRSARAVRRHGGGLAGAGAVLAGEVGSVVRSLGSADLVVEGVLGPGALAEVLAAGLSAAPDGGGAPGRAHPTPAGGADLFPVGRARPRPAATQPTWDAVRTDTTWHAVYWVAEWPRMDVGPEFLGPLLFAPLNRTLSVVLEPVDPARAARQVAQARTAGLADAELRRRGGFLSTARHQRERQSVEAREVELADGHAQLRYSGFVGVAAGSPDELEAACAALEQAAGHARLEVSRLFGQQDAALLCLLPLGRGLS
jgi:hypothetical protein